MDNKLEELVAKAREAKNELIAYLANESHLYSKIILPEENKLYGSYTACGWATSPKGEQPIGEMAMDLLCIREQINRAEGIAFDSIRNK